jgi:hypothetical protein
VANDCRTCAHNTYYGVTNEWVSCAHPITRAKTPDWKEGDPAMVSYRTGDVPASEIRELANCPTWEQRK